MKKHHMLSLCPVLNTSLITPVHYNLVPWSSSDLFLHTNLSFSKIQLIHECFFCGLMSMSPAASSKRNIPACIYILTRKVLNSS